VFQIAFAKVSTLPVKYVNRSFKHFSFKRILLALGFGKIIIQNKPKGFRNEH